MDQAALESRIAELQKQYPGLKFMGRSMKEKNRSRVDEDTGRTVTETVSVPVVEWRDPTTGYTLAAEVGPGGGTYTVTEDRLIPANKGDAERGNQPPKEEPNPADPTRMRRWNPSTNQWEDAGPNQTEIERRAREQAAASRPGAPTLKPDGKGGTVAIQTMPDGTIKTTPLPGVPSDKPNPPTITVEGVVYERGEDGVYKPAAGIPTPGIGVKNVDQFVPDYTQPDLGIGAWAAKQRAKIGLPPDQGGITQKDYDAAVTAARDQATVTITNITNNQNVVRQQAIDNQAREDKQAGYAENDLGRKQSVFDAIWKYTTPGSEAIRAWMPDAQSAQALRQQYAGQAKPMPVLHPMFTNLAANAGVTTPPPGAPPATQPGAPAPAAPPNAIGAGAIGNQPAPAGAPQMTPDAFVQTPAPAQPVTNMPVTTELPVQATGPNPTINPATGEPTGLNPLPEGARGPNPAINPVTGEPTGLPQQPEGPVGGRALPQPAEAPLPHEMTPAPGVYPTPFAPTVPSQTPTPGPNPYDETVTVTHYINGPTRMTRREWENMPEAEKQQYTPPPKMDPMIPVEVPYPTEDHLFTKTMPQQGPVTGWAMQALAQPPGTVAVQPQQQPMNPALQAAQQGAARSLFDPYETAGRMATLGIPQDAIAQAMRELGMIQDEVPA